MSEETDRALVDRAATGDREAFATLIERHYELIYRVGARVLGNDEAAADLAQDVCIGLAARLPSYRGESRFATWLYRVVVNAARDRLRRDGAQRRNEAAFAEVDAMTRAEQAAIDAEALWLRQMLGGLADDLRTTVVLVLQEGLRHAEAAEVLGISESTVSWRMHEARKRLRALAADEDVEP
ncbi:MAG: sigma-70 family RNA polymerase sigma factor [Rhodospirillales bacterium]|nr:sigma-70 family RNA polymerase sigma factor [Rhodospirillales bacterium]